MLDGFTERISTQSSTAPPSKAAVCDYWSSKSAQREQVLPLEMLYKSVNSFHLHHVLLLVQTYDTPNSRPVFCVQMYVYADAVAERDSLETCPRPLACSWKTPVCQVWDVATAKGVKWPLWAEVLRTSEARPKGQHWLSCCDNTIIFKWNAQSLAPPPPSPRLSGKLLILQESIHMPFSLLCSHTVFCFFFYGHYPTLCPNHFSMCIF